MIEHPKTPISKNGYLLSIGDKIKFVGFPPIGTSIHYNSSMLEMLGDDQIYTINNVGIADFGSYILVGEWSWDPRSVIKLTDDEIELEMVTKILSPEPVTFNVEQLMI